MKPTPETPLEWVSWLFSVRGRIRILAKIAHRVVKSLLKLIEYIQEKEGMMKRNA
jgi:hypothetical protein